MNVEQRQAAATCQMKPARFETRVHLYAAIVYIHHYHLYTVVVIMTVVMIVVDWSWCSCLVGVEF